MTTPPPALGQARELLQRERHGVLSTIHHQLSGMPFGSLAPYALTEHHEPVFLFSSIAEHTKNLQACARASLLVQDHAAIGNPIAGSRLTLVGCAETPDGPERATLLACYLARFPEAAAYATAHDFRPFVLRVERVRWIAGFGAMGWFDQTQWR